MKQQDFKAAAPISAKWQYAGAAGGIINTTETTLKAAVAGKRHVLSSMQIKNSAAVASEVIIRDGAGGTIIWRGHISTSMVNADEYNFDSELVGSDNKDLTITVLTTGTATIVSAQGYSVNTSGPTQFDANM